jgi:hypothetical protein
MGVKVMVDSHTLYHHIVLGLLLLMSKRKKVANTRTSTIVMPLKSTVGHDVATALRQQALKLDKLFRQFFLYYKWLLLSGQIVCFNMSAIHAALQLVTL